MKITINDSLCKSPLMKNMKFAAFLIQSLCKPTRPTLRELASNFKVSKDTATVFLNELDRLIEAGEIKGITWSIAPKKTTPDKKEMPFEERREKFYNELVSYLDRYDKKTIRAFYDYWSESDNKQKPKMKWETQQTWETSKRLARWSANNKKETGMDVGRILQNKGAVWEEELRNTKTGW